ncbi:Uncharacterized protein HZ326_22082 [Fusarium oxysporum f. sp. albedinis]|nr:Uncharacterized protein HZ326_27111 [Fusarium oxysporum f. sp. albedinis]KAJ0134877.1 Uncharacterized protein HZ326_22082 [Fusarium oxysporum f. sp. albedinis]
MSTCINGERRTPFPPSGAFLLVASPTVVSSTSSWTSKKVVLNRASLGKTLAGEKPKAARTLLYGRGSRLLPRSPASETNCRSPVVFQAAAEAAKKKRVSGQYATAEIGQAASELQKGQRAMWGPCVKVEGTKGPRKSSS